MKDEWGLVLNELEQAGREYGTAHAERARNALTDARNRLNKAQKEIDNLRQNLVNEAPRESDWGSIAIRS